MSAVEISVVVCTFNRADLLRICLDTLVAQNFPPDAYEVIVVDNNSSDRTAAVAAEFAARFPQVRSVFEAVQGLSNARNRGWQEAQGEYVGYVDDECKVPAGWLAAARAAISTHRPDILGGPYGTWYATPKPDWFKDEYGSTHFMGPEARRLPRGEYLSGGNMLIRRDILKTTGGFDPRFGMNGANIAFGEETVFQNRLRESQANCLIYYTPDLVLNHMVRPEKMQLSHMLRMSVARGSSSADVFAAAPMGFRPRIRFIAGSLIGLTRHCALAAWHSSIGLLVRDRSVFPHPQTYICENTMPHIQASSHLLRLMQKAILS